MKSALFIMIIGFVLVFPSTIHYILAVSSGPTVPNIPNTTSKYCSSSKCVTDSSYAPQNNSRSSMLLFHAPNGTFIHNMPFVGVQLSKTCIKLLQLNVISHCKSYHDLKKFDNTNPAFYGKWIFSNGYYHRLAPLVKQSWIFISNKPLVYVDPDPEFTTRAKMIIIQANNFTWINPDENGTNTKVITHVNRFVDSVCENAQVAPIDSLINDTINYLISSCTKTKFDDKVILYRPEIPFSWNNPYSQMKDPYFHANRNGTGGHGLSNCINHNCNIKDPYANW